MFLPNGTAGGAQFLTTPTDVVVNATESASVECSYENATAISWRRVGGASITGSTQGFQVTVVDEGSSILVIASADPSMAGDYICIAALEVNEEETAPFNITVQCELLRADASCLCLGWKQGVMNFKPNSPSPLPPLQSRALTLHGQESHDFSSFLSAKASMNP